MGEGRPRVASQFREDFPRSLEEARFKIELIFRTYGLSGFVSLCSAYESQEFFAFADWCSVKNQFDEQNRTSRISLDLDPKDFEKAQLTIEMLGILYDSAYGILDTLRQLGDYVKESGFFRSGGEVTH
jgi:hypothetical protein